MGQLALDLAFAPRYGADDFLVTPANEDAHATLARWPAWPGQVLLLAGPDGSGKSHLAAIWAATAAARQIEAADLQDQAPTDLVQTPLLIEDADRDALPEEALFHLLNRVREAGTHLLITARTPPDLWGLMIPDLLSRLRLAPLLRLKAPDEDLLRAVLVKLFIDRQLSVESSVVDYLALRLDRSLGAARRLVDALDKASLQSHRRITRPVAAETLAALSS